MKAMLTVNEELVWSEVEKCTPKDDEVLIKIYAAGVNRADLLQRLGKYPSPAGCPEWMGLEVAGTVEDIGSNVKQYKVGDRVCALLGGGGYAEYVCVTEGMVMPVPKGLSFETAASLPEAFATSYLNLFIEGHLEEGQTAYIPAGASGLASAAIPLAKAFGARVITSVREESIKEKISPLNADIILNSETDDLPEFFKSEEQAGRAPSVAMDCLSGTSLGECLPYMARGGYWVVISTLAGIETNVLLRPLLTKGLHLVGSMLRNRTPKQKTEILAKLVDKVWPKIESGQLKPCIYKVLPIVKAREAHAILERNENVGKVVLKIRDEE